MKFQTTTRFRLSSFIQLGLMATTHKPASQSVAVVPVGQFELIFPVNQYHISSPCFYVPEQICDTKLLFLIHYIPLGTTNQHLTLHQSPQLHADLNETGYASDVGGDMMSYLNRITGWSSLVILCREWHYKTNAFQMNQSRRCVSTRTSASEQDERMALLNWG